MSVSVKNRWIEGAIYLFFWVAFLLSPILGATFSDKAQSPDWSDVFRYWLFLCPAFLLFVVNNYLVMPRLLQRKRVWMYLLAVLVLVALCNLSYGAMMEYYKPNRGGVPPHECMECRGTSQGGDTCGMPHEEHGGEKPARHGLHPVIPLLPPSSMPTLLAVLVLVFNISVRQFFKAVRNEERIADMEKERLTQELEYLRYQINPHFLMNTLNNIHALIDIDGRRAQRAVIELSKMMRHMLYDASSSFVGLDKEIQFLNCYIDLMRLRCTDRLEVTTDFPADASAVSVPTLLFILFVENAFKHGVTHSRPSRIDVSIGLSGQRLCFKCRNTIGNGVVEPQEKHRGGIGIKNACKRLNLLYGDDYTLDISRETADNGELYHNVSLIIPVRYDKVSVG